MRNYYFGWGAIHVHSTRKLIRWIPGRNGWNHFYWLKFEIIICPGLWFKPGNFLTPAVTQAGVKSKKIWKTVNQAQKKRRINLRFGRVTGIQCGQTRCCSRTKIGNTARTMQTATQPISGLCAHFFTHTQTTEGLCTAAAPGQTTKSKIKPETRRRIKVGAKQKIMKKSLFS